MSKRRFYDVLGVSQSASEQEIRKAYRELARKYHPDRNQGDKQAEERFKEISAASEVLTNKHKRALYDEFGEMGLREGFDADAYRAWSQNRGRRPSPGSFGGMEDFWEQMRGARNDGGPGGGFGGFGSDVIDEVLRRAGANRGAGGRGGKRGQRPEVVSDLSVELLEAARGSERELTLQNADGEVRTLRVRIPAGVRDGGQVRLRGQADGADLVLRIHVNEHPLFRREDDDLALTLPITVGEAYHGAKIAVPTPDGPVQVRVPKAVKSGARLRLKGKGIRRGERTGDLFVQLQVVLPEGQSEALSAAVDTLEKAYAAPVRSGPLAEAAAQVASKTESSKTESSKTESSKTESSKTESSKTE